MLQVERVSKMNLSNLNIFSTLKKGKSHGDSKSKSNSDDGDGLTFRASNKSSE